MPVLQINGLTKHYGPIAALQELNLTIEAGNIYGLWGQMVAARLQHLASFWEFSPNRLAILNGLMENMAINTECVLEQY